MKQYTEWEYLLRNIKQILSCEILKEINVLIPVKNDDVEHPCSITAVEIKFDFISDARFFLQRTVVSDYDDGDNLFVVSEYTTGRVIAGSHNIVSAISNTIWKLKDDGAIKKMHEIITNPMTPILNK
jgi:hypothetical protein